MHPADTGSIISSMQGKLPYGRSFRVVEAECHCLHPSIICVSRIIHVPLIYFVSTSKELVHHFLQFRKITFSSSSRIKSFFHELSLNCCGNLFSRVNHPTRYGPLSIIFPLNAHKLQNILPRTCILNYFSTVLSFPPCNDRISRMVGTPPSQYTPACNTSPAHHVHWPVVLVHLVLPVMAHPVHPPVQLVPDRGEPISPKLRVSPDGFQYEGCSELYWCIRRQGHRPGYLLVRDLKPRYLPKSSIVRSVEASEAVALAKEESFEEIIRDLTQRLKDAETRASEGEKQVSDLSKDIENNEKELASWMEKHSAIYRELETTYNEMSGY